MTTYTIASAAGLLLATVPAIIFGLFLGLIGESMLRVPGVIATTSIVFGLALGWVDWRAPCTREPDQIGWHLKFGPGGGRVGHHAGMLDQGLDRTERFGE